MTRIASLLIAIVLFPASAAAQDPPAIKNGTRVRLWTSSSSAPFIGRVTAQDGQSFTLRAEGFDEPVTVERRAISKLERKVGGRTAGRSILNGALVGAGFAMALGLVSGNDAPNQFFSMTGPEKGLFFSILTVPAGVVIGAIAGSSPDKWATVALPADRSTLANRLPAPTLRMTLRF